MLFFFPHSPKILRYERTTICKYMITQTSNMKTTQIQIIIYSLVDTHPKLNVPKTSYVHLTYVQYRLRAQKGNTSVRRGIIYMRPTFT